jgi:hypothetical protein
MPASTVTSTTGVVTGADPNFVVTYKTNSLAKVIALIKYAKTAQNLTTTFEIINPSIHATDKYKVTVQIADGSTIAKSITQSASGNWRVPLDIVSSDKIVVAACSYVASNGGDTAVVNFIEE